VFESSERAPPMHAAESNPQPKPASPPRARGHATQAKPAACLLLPYHTAPSPGRETTGKGGPLLPRGSAAPVHVRWSPCGAAACGEAGHPSRARRPSQLVGTWAGWKPARPREPTPPAVRAIFLAWAPWLPLHANGQAFSLSPQHRTGRKRRPPDGRNTLDQRVLLL
jgi:hypothetical protein